MITTHDSPMLRSHDEARELLAYAVPGARVELWRPAGDVARESTRSYRITVRRWGREDVAVFGGYTLPCDAARLAAHARDQVAKAIA